MQEPYDSEDVIDSKSKSRETRGKSLFEDSPEKARARRVAGHRDRNEILSSSISTTASNQSPGKAYHAHTKSMMNMVEADEEDEDASFSLELHDGKIEVEQNPGAPILFTKGGYDQHLDIKSTKSNQFRKSVCEPKRKGGFINADSDNPLAVGNQASGISPLKINKIKPKAEETKKYNEEMENFLAGKLDFSKKPTSKTPKHAPKKSVGYGGLDPLSDLRAAVLDESSNKSVNAGHKRFASTSSIKITNRLTTQDPLFSDAKDAKIVRTKTRESQPSFLKEYSNESPSTAMATDYKAETPLHFGFSGHHSRGSSVIILEDELSESGIDFGDQNLETEETPTSDFSFLFEKKIPTDSTPTATPNNKCTEKVIQEYKSLQKEEFHSQGIFVIPSSNPLVWSCVVFIKGGYYEKGKFKFSIQFPKNYPSGNIKVYSATKIYHPLINIETGELDLKVLTFENAQEKVKTIILFLKSMFNDSKYLEDVNSFNHDAGLKYSNQTSYFKIQAKGSVKSTENNTLTENKPAPEDMQKVRDLIKTVSSGSEKFEDKLKSLIEGLKKEVTKA